MNSSSRQGHQKQHSVRRWQRIRLEMSEQVRLTAYHEGQQDAPDWGRLAGQQRLRRDASPRADVVAVQSRAAGDEFIAEFIRRPAGHANTEKQRRCQSRCTNRCVRYADPADCSQE